MSCSWCFKRANLYEKHRLYVGYCQESCQNSLYAFVESKRARDGAGDDKWDVDFENLLSRYSESEKLNDDLRLVWVSSRKQNPKLHGEDLISVFDNYLQGLEEGFTDEAYASNEEFDPVYVQMEDLDTSITLEINNPKNFASLLIKVKKILPIPEQEEYVKAFSDNYLQKIAEFKKLGEEKFAEMYPDDDGNTEYYLDLEEDGDLEESLRDTAYDMYTETYMDEAGGYAYPKENLSADESLPPILQALSRQFSLKRKDGNVLYQSIMSQLEASERKRVEIATYFSVAIFLIQNKFDF
jgi:hypothetical protein